MFSCRESLSAPDDQTEAIPEGCIVKKPFALLIIVSLFGLTGCGGATTTAQKPLSSGEKGEPDKGGLPLPIPKDAMPNPLEKAPPQPEKFDGKFNPFEKMEGKSNPTEKKGPRKVYGPDKQPFEPQTADKSFNPFPLGNDKHPDLYGEDKLRIPPPDKAPPLPDKFAFPEKGLKAPEKGFPFPEKGFPPLLDKKGPPIPEGKDKLPIPPIGKDLPELPIPK